MKLLLALTHIFLLGSLTIAQDELQEYPITQPIPATPENTSISATSQDLTFYKGRAPDIKK